MQNSRSNQQRSLAPYELLTETQVAQRLGVSIATVRRWRLRGAGPKFRKIGASVRYPVADLNAWIDAQPTGGDDTCPR